MSRFFRSGNSTSSSEDEEEVDIKDEDSSVVSAPNADRADADLASQTTALSIAGHLQTSQSNQSSQQWTSHHKDVLLHALLEDYCLNETLKSHPGANRETPQVKVEAKAKYLRLVSELAPLDVLPAGLGADQHAATRQRYRDVLGVFDPQQARGAVPSGTRRLLTDGNTEAGQMSHQQALGQVPNGYMQDQLAMPAPLRRLLGYGEQSAAIHNSFISGPSFAPQQGLMQQGIVAPYGQTRYRSDFEELSILGRGGYGIVYHARNRLDNQAYAVKKVPLSMARLHRIRTRGQPEVDEILQELRTLARLHHPNIVRYFNAWVEWVDGSVTGAVDSLLSGSPGVTDTSDAVAGAQDESLFGRRRVFTEDDGSDGNGIVFEHSGIEHDPQGEASETPPLEDSEPDQLRRTGTRSTLATASSEEVETIDRSVSPDVSMSFHSTADGAAFAQPTLAIHIQMGLHPMTLADLLANKDSGLKHCYHIEPSIGITLAVLDGLEYLHDEGIVHRDIKPANIFLSPSRRRSRECVDLSRCSGCDYTRAEGEGGEVEICIGDFGLAAVAGPEASSSPASREPVGTAIYRPTTRDEGNSSARSLDLYALGIVFFELLWRFETRMERLQCIHALKEEGKFPEGFDGRARDVVRGMLGASSEVGSVRDELRELLSGAETAR